MIFGVLKGMGPSVRVVIVRHGESTFNLEGRFQGYSIGLC